MEGKEASLLQVLEFREMKAAIQEEMRTRMPDGTVISLSLNVPGPVKRTPPLSEAFGEGRRCLERVIARQGGNVVQKAVLEETAGYAAVYLVEGTRRMQWKRELVVEEETHALGRIWDMDVLDEEGRPIAREAVGAPKRTCLVCGEDAKACGRSRAHDVRKLQDKVYEILHDWKEGRA